MHLLTVNNMKGIFFFFLFSIPVLKGAMAQQVFSDVGTTSLLVSNGFLINSKMKNSNKILDDFSKTQNMIGAQLEDIQRKHSLVLKGLQEVSGVLSDAITVKNIYSVMNDINKHIANISSFAASNPQYLTFTSKAMGIARGRMTNIATEITSLLSSNQNLLMNSGRRKEFLNEIYFDLMMLRSSLYGILFSMESAKRIGFWKALNPFQKYINQDKIIMQDIIRKAGYLKR